MSWACDALGAGTITNVTPNWKASKNDYEWRTRTREVKEAWTIIAARIERQQKKSVCCTTSAKFRSVIRLWPSTTKLSEAEITPKKRWRSPFGSLQPVLHFWIMAKPLRHRSTSEPALANRKFFLYDSVTSQVTKTTLQKLTQLTFGTLSLPSYSPELSPTYYLFNEHFYNFMPEKCFNNLDDVKNAFDDIVWAEICARTFWTILIIIKGSVLYRVVQPKTTMFNCELHLKVFYPN